MAPPSPEVHMLIMKIPVIAPQIPIIALHSEYFIRSILLPLTRSALDKRVTPISLPLQIKTGAFYIPA
jgi:hypothetical protein